ncbi:MAG: hypothetical protein GY938_17970 [Ketobacter sp.]|nr:hypothetical protein [Ketobacter sp.]
MTLYCDNVVNHGITATIEATALPSPSATNTIGSAQQVVPIMASPRPLIKEVSVFIFSVFIEIESL